jgi:hypothetical protein
MGKLRKVDVHKISARGLCKIEIYMMLLDFCQRINEKLIYNIDSLFSRHF